MAKPTEAARLREARNTSDQVVTGSFWEARGVVDMQPGLKPVFDEIVTGTIDSVHIEQMDDGLYWMALNKGEKRLVITFSSVSGRAAIAGRFEEE
jgi:hypothetical protein